MITMNKIKEGKKISILAHFCQIFYRQGVKQKRKVNVGLEYSFITKTIDYHREIMIKEFNIFFFFFVMVITLNVHH